MNEKQAIVITCAPYNGPVLAEEIKALGYPIKGSSILEVSTEGTLQDCMYLNLHLRTANRVLYRLRGFRCGNADQLYRQLQSIKWDRYIAADSYFSVGSYVKNDTMRDTRFANLRVKDAIVDNLQKRYGSRPDSGPRQDNIVVFLHWKEQDAAIYLDTSGESIAKHGYRRVTVEAPMQEALAAAVVQSTRWQPDAPLVNPMCGSGTIAIEAALLKAQKPPGLLRSNFAFMHLKGYEANTWQQMCQQAEDLVKQNITALSKQVPQIIATDEDGQAVAAARQNASLAGIVGLIRFEVAEFRDTELPPPQVNGVVIINPPYGERLGEEEELATLYQQMGDFFKQRCAGYFGYIFTGNLKLAKRVGLRTKRRVEFANAKIESRLLEYELYTGKR